jgi:adenosylmethionine-8-amino-7-oxononanoate aminotransferase
MVASVFYRSNKSYPVAERAEGIYIYSQGKRFLDGSSGALVANIGYGHKEVAQAISRQAAKLPFVHSSQFCSAVLEEYAAKLTSFLGLAGFSIGRI